MDFEFATSNRIIFGPGSLQKAAPLVKERGAKALVVIGRCIRRVIPLLEQLKVHRIDYILFSVPGEPTINLIDQALAKARTSDVDVVIGFGGGSVIDAGKAIAAMITNPGDVLDYLEVIGAGRKLVHAPHPYIAIPTTAGTGTEATKNAVLLSEEHGVKVSLRHNLMLPNVAIVDPELTLSMPPAVTASSGLDALTQLIEPFVSNRANPLTDGICREGIVRASRSLRTVYENGADKLAREDMAVASLFGGLALANAKLGAVHGFAGPLGGMLRAPHGAICARLLPWVMQQNIRALKKRSPESTSLQRYKEIAQMITRDHNATAEDGVEWVRSLVEALDIPTLSHFGLTEQEIPIAVQKAQKSSSMKGNPVALTHGELTTILKLGL